MMFANLSFGRSARQLTVAQRAQVQDGLMRMVYRQLKVKADRPATPQRVEQVMMALDGGLLDDELARLIPAEPVRAEAERFDDVPEFDHAAWKARHNVAD